MKFAVQMLDPMINSIVDMLYYHLLTGETEEVPNDWNTERRRTQVTGSPVPAARCRQRQSPLKRATLTEMRGI